MVPRNIQLEEACTYHPENNSDTERVYPQPDKHGHELRRWRTKKQETREWDCKMCSGSSWIKEANITPSTAR